MLRGHRSGIPKRPRNNSKRQLGFWRTWQELLLCFVAVSMHCTGPEFQACGQRQTQWRFDRFARSTKHLLLALEEFRSLGIQFISYQENIDTTSPLGQALFTIVSAVAQLERDLIRERVSAGIRHARACGKNS